MHENGDTVPPEFPVPDDVKHHFIPLATSLETAGSYFRRNSSLNCKRSPKFFFTINELCIVNRSHSTGWSKVIFFLILVEVPKSTHNSQWSSRAFHNVLPSFPRRWWKRATPKLRNPVTLWKGWLWLVWGSEAKFCGWRNGWRTQAQNTKQKTQKPSHRFKLLDNFIYPFYTHTQHVSYTVIHTLCESKWQILISVSPD